MQISDMCGTLKLKDDIPVLKFGEETPIEQLEEVLNFYNEEGEKDRLRLNTSSQPGKIIIEFSEDDPIDLRSVALDLQEEGAQIKIDPEIKLEKCLQKPIYLRTSYPEKWEFGNHQISKLTLGGSSQF